MTQVTDSRLKPLVAPNLKPVATGEPMLIVLLDASGSMGAPMGANSTRLSVAVKVLQETLLPRSAGVSVSILVFGGFHNVLRWVTDLRQIYGTIGGGTPLQEALHLAWERVASVHPRRLLLLTDGEPNGGGATKSAILSEAPGRATVIDIVGIGAPGSPGYDPEFLRRLASLTGGEFRKAHNAADLAKTIARLSPQERPLLP